MNTIGKLAVRIFPDNPNHHLWNNNGTWWCHVTEHLAGYTKQRLRLSLKTSDLTLAKQRRDKLLSSSGKVLVLLAAFLFALQFTAEAQLFRRKQDPVPIFIKGEGLEPVNAEKKSSGSDSVAGNGQLAKDMKSYEQSLRDLAGEAENLIKAMPQDLNQLAERFDKFEKILQSSLTLVNKVLAQRGNIDAKAQAALQSVANTRQIFIDFAKQIEADIEEVNREGGDQVNATQAIIGSLNAAKERAQRQQTAFAPLKDWVLDAQKISHQAFAELKFYPLLLTRHIELCRAYRQAVGEPGEFLAAVEGLKNVRAHLQKILQSIHYQADQAESMIQNIPKLPQQSSPPVVPSS